MSIVPSGPIVNPKIVAFNSSYLVGALGLAASYCASTGPGPSSGISSLSCDCESSGTQKLYWKRDLPPPKKKPKKPEGFEDGGDEEWGVYGEDTYKGKGLIAQNDEFNQAEKTFISEKLKDKRDQGNLDAVKRKRKAGKDNKDIEFIEEGKFKIKVGGLQILEIMDGEHFDL